MAICVPRDSKHNEANDDGEPFGGNVKEEKVVAGKH